MYIMMEASVVLGGMMEPVASHIYAGVYVRTVPIFPTHPTPINICIRELETVSCKMGEREMYATMQLVY